MVSENNVWWQKLKSYANGSFPRYGDIGDYATIAFQMTGDSAYARKAWSLIQPFAQSHTLPWANRNGTREYFITYVWMYDWLYPGLTPAQRTTFISYLNWMGDLVLNKVSGVPWGTRTSDSDETIGHYFGLAFLDLATAPDNPRAGTFLKSSWIEAGTGKLTNVGGLAATKVDRSTMRNTIAQFVSEARGGEWIESSEYDCDTLQLILLGAEGVRTATGVDYFPEITQFAPQAALSFIDKQTPDGLDTYQWGDEEHPHGLWIQTREAAVSVMAGVTARIDPNISSYTQSYLNDLIASPIEYHGGANPYPRFFLLFNPYNQATDWRTILPAGFYASGQGMMYFHDGWGANDSFFGAHDPTTTAVDHQVNFLGDFQLYRQGEWALTHPLGYALASVNAGGSSTNGMEFAGVTEVSEARGPVAQEFGPNGDSAYLVGSTGGQYVWTNFWTPPPTFLHEWTRSLLYLPSEDKHSDTIVVYDRTNSEDPRLLPLSNRYGSDLPAINAATSLKQWIIHMPVAPTLTPSGISWTTPGGQNINVSTLLPVNQQKTAYDETQLGWISWTIVPTEEKWQARIAPAVDAQWDTFLNVVQAYDTGTTLANTMVRSDGGQAEGALIQRGSQDDVLALFSAQMGVQVPVTLPIANVSVYNPNMLAQIGAVRILGAGYSVTWTGGSAQTEVMLMDLDPNRTWTAVVDGNAGISVPVSNQGIGRFSLNGVGTHQFTLSAN